MSYPEPTYIYHFTHAKNLPAILSAGRVYCQSQLPEGKREVDLSHLDLQDKRRRKHTGCGPGGTLHDFVPFYFAPRSPMMYRHSKNHTEQYQGGTTPLIYLVSTVQRIQEHRLEFVFSDGHPVVPLFSKFYDDIGHLGEIDWKLMRSRYWFDTVGDPDRSRRRMAEFLVYGEFPWDAVEFLAVKNVRLKERLEGYLQREWPHRIKPVRVEAGWYF
ncbi:type II toxin-antitoxin system toxin DNA ADP-ribosyl transferase DarT [Rubrobacter aplysinae]|uniref:type II toxin-antitoxin system toxin DNA ADP-ribosyl transferase DarT n=1 Tax=Rubrobacter aplysinae TaxID=909625 RepID=UPI00064BCBA1|nr:DUF4433 domain-containing protein [Rubrobacter aplysinae]